MSIATWIALGIIAAVIMLGCLSWMFARGVGRRDTTT